MAEQRLCPPPQMASDPAFLRALDLDFVAGLVQQHLLVDATLRAIEPAYVRWKDRDGSLLGFRLQVQMGDDVWQSYATVRTATAARLASEAERIIHRRGKVHCGVRSVAHVPEHGVLLVGYPLDRVMREMRHLVRASKVRGLLLDHCPEFVPEGLRISKGNSSGALISYKPERRAVVRWQIGLMDEQGVVQEHKNVWLRCHAQPQAQRSTVACNAARLAGVVCPETLGIAHEQLLVESHVPGRAWQPVHGNDQLADVAKVAKTIARLHRAELVASLPVHGPLAELDLALRSADDLRRLDNELGDTAQKIADELAATVPQPAALVLAHGDLHPDQILIDDDAALVDFDRACLAPAAHDLATMRAHLVATHEQEGERMWQLLAAAYGRVLPLPSGDDLSWWTACALLRLAIRPFRSLHAQWPTVSARILAAAKSAAGAAGTEELA